MKKQILKKVIGSKVFLLGLTGLLMLAACQKTKVSPTNESSTEDKQSINQDINSFARTNDIYTGEEIFEGIFFSKGDFATLLPQFGGSAMYANYTADQLLIRDNTISTVESALKQSDPEYFSKLKNNFKNANIMQFDEIIRAISLDISMIMLKDVDKRTAFINTYGFNANEINSIVNNNDKLALLAKINSKGHDAILPGDVRQGTGMAFIGPIAVAIAAAYVVVFVKVYVITQTNRVAYTAGGPHELATAELYTALSRIN